MRSFNSCMFIGFVGQDPEVKEFESGKKKASFSIATTETYKNKEGKKVDTTEWHNFAVYGKLAEIVEKYVKKGSCLRITAKHKTESWDNGNGGKNYKSVFVVESLDFLDSKMASSTDVQEANTQAQETDDLPF